MLGKISLTPNAWAVYKMQVGAWDLYAGTCRIRDLGKWPDAMRNPAMREMFTVPEVQENGTFFVLAYYEHITEAESHVSRLIDASPNMKMYWPDTDTTGIKKRKIIEDETGLIFDSQTDACTHYGINPGNFSAHMRGLSAKVAGRTFRYMNHD